MMNTPSSFYNGHAITDIVLFWEKINGQRLQRTTLSLDVKGQSPSPPPPPKDLHHYKTTTVYQLLM